ncbi:MAG: 2Fe-2S iron-sulfur cluster binding domain-containing protein [Myxococcales bacterium]|nr:2Fe-2S iron-sulfur cluster binding domain-containing protein [Myxococcales bacterium]
MAVITFIDPEGSRREVAAEPYQTLLEVAEEHGVKMGSACGGVCACSSCHCYIREGADELEEMGDIEEDRLDMGFDVRPESRLGCQVRVPRDPVYLVVEISQESLETWYNEHPEHRDERHEKGA